MSNLIGQLGPWSWWILAGILLLLELTMPGVFFMWLAIAALAVGAIAFFTDFGWQIEVLLFAILSVAFVLLLRPRFRDRMHASDQPNLNQRMLNYVGQTFQLSVPIVNGRGHLSIDDTFWEIEGPDMAAGQKIRVTGVDGTRLKVKGI